VIYLTYNDQPSGIYNSQVIDVINYFNTIQSKEEVKLVALISIRNYFTNRKKIKERLPNSVVLPMAPGASRWKWNAFPLQLFKLVNRSEKIMARGPFATALALSLKQKGKVKKVIFDARGAYKAELNEYDVVNDEMLKHQISHLEQDVLRRSDAILAVSQALVNYWRTEYNFVSDKHVVIPCTLSKDFMFEFPPAYELTNIKKEIGFAADDIVIVYSGSSAGWQSFSLVEKLLDGIMSNNEKVKLLWLTHDLNENSEFVKKFKSRIKTNWLKPADVRKYLLAADYGLLYREPSVTNQVASPVKFAEYLSCGLNVIISEQLGDFSEFVKAHGCGSIGDAKINLTSLGYEVKKRNHDLAMQQLTKTNYTKAYLSLLD
jgi:hypothetical protein